MVDQSIIKSRPTWPSPNIKGRPPASESPKRKVTKYVPSLRSQCGRYPRVRLATVAELWEALFATRTPWLRIRKESNSFNLQRGPAAQESRATLGGRLLA